MLLRYWIIRPIVIFFCLIFLLSCATFPREYDASGDSEEKAYIHFVADTENIPSNYDQFPSFKLIFKDPYKGLFKAFSISRYSDLILTLEPGPHSFLIYPYWKNLSFNVKATAFKDSIVKVNCYIIIRGEKTDTSREVVGLNRVKTTYTTTINYNFFYTTEAPKPYPQKQRNN